MASSQCVVCCASAATVYCCQDDANLCKACSSMIHSANALAARHTVLPFCALCNVNRPTVFCRNDDAYLCAGCDKEAHVGVLASRHDRVPAASAKVEKLSNEEVFGESSCGAHSEVLGDNPPVAEPSPTSDFGVVPVLSLDEVAPAMAPSGKPWGKDLDSLDVDSAWLDRLDMGFDFSDLLDGEPMLFGDAHLSAPANSDGLVPTMAQAPPPQATAWSTMSHQVIPKEEAVVPLLPLSMSDEPFPAWFDSASDAADANLHEVPDLMEDDKLIVPCMDMLEATGVGLSITTASAIASVTAEQAAINRAERLAKCREKKKNRTFEKTIRYATRKAYAEVRPRIKGRFVKKEELEAYYAMHSADMMMVQDESVPTPTLAC